MSNHFFFEHTVLIENDQNSPEDHITVDREQPRFTFNLKKKKTIFPLHRYTSY